MAYKKPLSEPIAVVGSGCRFAGDATSPSKLWDVLCEAPDLSRKVPYERFNADAFFHPDGEHHGTTNSVDAYWLEQDHRVFDSRFFSITPMEAEAMDPQQRLLLEVVYEAMESAGYSHSTYNGENVSVFSGVMTADYDTLSQRDELVTSQYYATGNARSIISNRISYVFNFKGPSMTIDTACSSSLVALHQAVLSLRSGGCIMACVTGVNLMITPEQFIVESSLHMLSPTGKSRMWDASADGYARGEGVAALLLKPLSRALADGDQIMAVIRESGSNSDGRTNGITMPNPEAQSALIKDTYLKSGLNSMVPEDQCQYFEAHGTGTPAGDPREAEAIYKAFFGDDVKASETGADTSNRLLVGSIKTVLGHTEGAAGLAGLLKVIQAMKHGLIPPNLHLNKINPTVEPFCTRLEVPTSLVPWPKPPAGQPKRASVNSFGFGGANAHVIVESYEPAIHGERPNKMADLDHAMKDIDQALLPFPLFLSAASQKTLRQVVEDYRDYLLQHPLASHEELSWALYAHRSALPFRLAISATSQSQAIEALGAILERSDTNELGIRCKKVENELKILGIFTGQGAQWATMSRSLFLENEVYRDTIRNLDVVLQALPEPPVWTLEGQIMAEEKDSLVNVAAVSQPFSTALQIGLVDLLASLGIGFHTVVGHSSGEIAAAYAAGKITARDAILISYHRGHLTGFAMNSEGQKGGMLAAGISEQEALEFCNSPAFIGKIYVAASNAPASVTLSGDLDAIKMAHEELVKNEKFSRMLRVDAAYHSPHMMTPSSKYVDSLMKSGIKPDSQGNGTIWVSSVYGETLSGDEDLSAGYWRDNMVRMVRFRDAVVYALQKHGPFDCAIEIGPHTTLKGPLKQTAEEIGLGVPYTHILARGKDDTLAISDFLGYIWSRYDTGTDNMNFRKYIEQSHCHSVLKFRLHDLPTYPWDHSQIHYRESRISRQYHFKEEAPHELLGVRTRDDNVHELRWRNLLKGERLPWAAGHAFQGQALLPASAYCIMALDAARFYLNVREAEMGVSVVELEDIQIMSGINIDRESAGVEVLFTFSVVPPRGELDEDSIIEANFSLTSAPADGTTDMRLNMVGHMKIHLGDPNTNALPRRNPAESEAFEGNPESFYHMMEETGLMYTGPFRALTSFRRRFNYCNATLNRVHETDTTKLWISPATLDVCFQSAFLTYSSPGDKALWTSFLPTSIKRIQFSTATRYESRPEKTDKLIVDTHLTDVETSTRDSKARFTVEIGISNEDGEMEIQVEGLSVEAIAQIQPRDDHELYLHTVMDVDPTDKIIGEESFRDSVYDPVLVESCARVAAYFDTEELDMRGDYHGNYFRRLAESFPVVLNTLNAHSWLNETFETITSFIESSDYYECLNLLLELGERPLDISDDTHYLADVLPDLVNETHYLSCFNKHVGRIVKQIAHRYPLMNILGLAGPEAELLIDVLSSLGSSFSSFTVGTETTRDPAKHAKIPEWASKKVVSSPLDFTGDFETQLKSDKPFDLALVSVSQLESGSEVNMLKSIRSVMRPGGFLVLVNNRPKTSMKNRFLRIGRDEDEDEAGAPTPPEWPDVLDAYGFIEVARNSNQSYYPGYTVMVRQLATPMLELVKQPSRPADASVTNHLLILGGNEKYKEIVDSLMQRLQPLCQQVSLQTSFEDTDSQILNNCTAAIILTDLDEALMTSMTERKLDHLRELLRPEMQVLWLTCNSQTESPSHAATFGFTRTISAEIPRLTLQMLDLEQIEGSGHLIADAFIRLMGARDVESDTLWSQEREIHMNAGRRMIPRVLPLQQGNDRVNALRRYVSHQVNTLLECVEVVPHSTPNGLIGYDTRNGQVDPQNMRDDRVLVRVDYSSVDSIKLNSQVSAYVCCGHNLSTGGAVIALSESNASYISVPKEHVFSLPSEAMRNSVHLVHHVMTQWIISEIISRTEGRRVVLLGVDYTTHENVRAGGRFTTSYSTDLSEADHDHRWFPLHQRSSTRQIKAIFPSPGAVIFNLLPDENAKLSKKIRELLPANCEYHSRATLFGTGESADKTTLKGFPSIASAWNNVVTVVVGYVTNPGVYLRSYAGPNVVSLSNLQSRTGIPWSPTRILNWRANRNATSVAKHIVQENLFHRSKTYVLAGMTGDFGQSLCYLFVRHGARQIILASRSAKGKPEWAKELMRSYSADVQMRQVDVTSVQSVLAFKNALAKEKRRVGGIVNGAMVLDDRVFAQMSINTWQRVMRPKTVGSYNLSMAFSDDNLEFFIMTSSFAAIGGHPGQSNYAAANMYMNGLAGWRRHRGLAGSVLNIGVIYGIGFLQREKEELYAGLEREGYPPISERDIHHMFLEAIVAGRPGAGALPPRPYDITTGLSRYDPADPNPLHWHQDVRFSHYTRRDNLRSEGTGAAAVDIFEVIGNNIANLTTADELSQYIQAEFIDRLESTLRLPKGSVTPGQGIPELGVDSLVAVEIRGWFYKAVGKDVSVIKLLGGTSIQKLCEGVAEQIVADRAKDQSDDAQRQ
ncbi:hypothetical protein AAE478_006260 [Parahypoxylon ruwenzoriense]